MTAKLALHIAHYKRADVQRICGHNQRYSSNLPDHVTPELINGDYQASNGQPIRQIQYDKEIRKTLEAYGMQQEKTGHALRWLYADGRPVRKDANIMTSVVVTLDRTTATQWGPEKTKLYFKECSSYLEDLFGNKIDDAVHTDEEGAGYHMHFVGISMLQDKAGIFKLNVKKVWTRSSLRQLHTNLAQHLQEKGYSVERGVEYSDIDYTEDYKQLKRGAKKVQLTVSYLDKVLDVVNAQAQHQEASPGVFGIGKKDAAALIPEPTFNMLIECLKQEKQALVDNLNNQARKDRSQQLKLAQEKIANLEADIVSIRRKYQSELNRLQDDQEQLEQSIPVKIEKAKQEAIKDYEKQNSRIINAGKSVEPILHYADLVAEVNAIRQEAIDRSKSKKKNRTKQNDKSNSLEM